jgi:hypothetical protein
MQNILEQIDKWNHSQVPQTVSEFIVLQMAIKAGDPHLYHPYLRIVENLSLAHCLEIFRQEQKLPLKH